MAQVSSRLDALAYIISPLLPESRDVHRRSGEGDKVLRHRSVLRV